MASRVLPLALVGVLAFVAGVALAPVFRWSTGGSAPLGESFPTELALQSDELTPLLKELRQALEVLTVEVRRREGESTPPTEIQRRRLPEESSSQPEPTELAAALKSLADAISALRSDAGSAGGSRPEELEKPSFVDRERAFAATGMEQAAAAGEQALEAARAKLNKDHMFLTNQAVLSRYGMPDNRYCKDSKESWAYELTRQAGNLVFEFHFHSGTVYECEFEF